MKIKNLVSRVVRLMERKAKKITSRHLVKQFLAIFPEMSDKRNLLKQIACVKNIERNMIGRYCGSLEDKIMQSMCYQKASQYFPADPKYAHVEIGVLFGGSVLLKLSILREFSKNHTVIAIDPLEGYYQSKLDPVTKLEVNESIFLKNVAKFGFNKNQIKIIKKFSTDPSILPILKKYTILTLMIDGDHSYEGVKYDWTTYSPLVARLGYVIFDDYNDPGWPEVTRFVDELITSRPEEWKVVGFLDTTLIMQRIK